MAGNYAALELMGTLTKDPEVRYLASGMAVVQFDVAVNKRYKDKEGVWKEKVAFIQCKLWGKRGEAFARFHGKGSACFVYGEVEMDSWEDKQTGKKRSKLYLNGRGFEFMGKAQQERPMGGARSDPVMERQRAPVEAGKSSYDVDEVPF